MQARNQSQALDVYPDKPILAVSGMALPSLFPGFPEDTVELLVALLQLHTCTRIPGLLQPEGHGAGFLDSAGKSVVGADQISLWRLCLADVHRPCDCAGLTRWLLERSLLQTSMAGQDFRASDGRS